MANITTQTIRVDLSTGKVIPTAYTHQNDTARTLVFDMYNGGLPYTMTGNTVKFAYKSPIVDGAYTVITGSGMASGTVSDNKVTVTLPSEYTAISGVGMLTMIITPTSGTVRPVNIRLVVQKAADGADVVAGASDMPDYLAQVAEQYYSTYVTQDVAELQDALITGSAKPLEKGYGYVQASNGELLEAGRTYSFSDLIPVQEGEIYAYTLSGSASVCIIAAYTSSDTVTASLSSSVVGKSGSPMISDIYVVPSGISYLRISTKSIGDCKFYPYRNQFLPKFSIVNNTEYNIDEMVIPGIYTSQAANLANNGFPPASSAVGVFVVTKEPKNTIVYQTYIESYTGMVYTRIKRNSGWTDWAFQTTKKSISILFVGNSLTQDGIAYLPYLLKNYYQNIDFKFYIWYNGGKTLSEQYEYFTNDTPCDTFSVAENSTSWTNYNSSVTMASILGNYTFDIVCMQEYFNYKEEYTPTDLQDWENCQDYIQSHYDGGNALEFISLFHAPKRDSADSVFSITKAGNAAILSNTIAEDMIPIGIAIYRAMATALDSLGDLTHLTPDGTHAQEGLPCLMQTYVALLWLFDKLDINQSVYGHPFRMTTAIYNSINVPGANVGSGMIVGTDAENILAQEIAIKAYKEGKQFVAENISANNT